MTAPVAALGRGVARRIARVGALARFFRTGVVRRVARLGALARFFLAILAAAPFLSRAGRRVTWRILLNQVWFTALQAIPLLIVVAGILSFLTIFQFMDRLGRLGAVQYLGTLMVTAIVRELGPLVTALIVAGRSGTAIAAELATNKVMGEVNALEGMGIDPLHYLVLPRFFAAIYSVFGLMILFDLVALGAGLVAASANGMSAPRYFDLVLEALTLQDVWLTIAKGLVFGGIVGTVPSFFGLRVSGRSTEVPVAASQAMVLSMLAIFVSSAVFVLFTL